MGSVDQARHRTARPGARAGGCPGEGIQRGGSRLGSVLAHRLFSDAGSRQACHLRSTFDAGGVRSSTLAGAWQPIVMCLLPGPIVPADGSQRRRRDDRRGVPREHAWPAESLGAVSSPRPGGALTDEPWFVAYRLRHAEQFIREMSTWAVHSIDTFGSCRSHSQGRLAPATRLRVGAAQSRFTKTMLEISTKYDEVDHAPSTRPQVYGELPSRTPGLDDSPLRSLRDNARSKQAREGRGSRPLQVSADSCPC